MKNFLTRTTDICHYICEKQLAELSEIKARPVGLDGTCGRGNDTLWLAGFCRKVYGFDVQEEALADTRKLLEDSDVAVHTLKCKTELAEDREEGVLLIQDGHENILTYVDEGIDIALFNLGYLPGGSKEIATRKENTITALNAALQILNPGGIIGVTVYWGHDSGKEERQAVTQWAEELPKSVYHCLRMDMVNQSNSPPENFFITRKK